MTSERTQPQTETKAQTQAKTATSGLDNTEKDPNDWVTGEEPMTGAQTSYLKTLTEQAKKPELFEDGLTKAEASKRIDELKQTLGH